MGSREAWNICWLSLVPRLCGLSTRLPTAYTATKVCYLWYIEIAMNVLPSINLHYMP